MEIEVQNLTFSYGKQPALREVSFSVQKGTLTAVLGANGAGKSTLFRCNLGFLRPEGEILLRGRPVRSLTQRELSREIAYIPQSAEPIFNYTVLDTVLMGTTGTLQLAQRPGKAQLEAAHRALDQLEIAHLAKRGCSQVSGGERQRLGVARAFLHDAPFILLDEPTSNLDLRNQHDTLSMVSEIAKEKGISVLMAIHDINLAVRYCDKFLTLKNGRLHSCGGIETLTKECLEEVYGISVKLANINGRTVAIADKG